MAEMLGTNSTIEKIIYTGCGSTPTDGAALVAAFEASDSLKSLDLNYNDVGDEVEAELKAAMEAKAAWKGEEEG